jgi:hypothetical protein
MFPETDEISNIISDTVKVVFKQRLVDRVLRLWTEMARGQGFPSRDQIEPSKLSVDWRNCLVIAVQSPVQLSYLVAVGENLSFTHCPADSGFKREEAARFSFLLGLPAIALAGLKELAELRHAGLDAHGWLVLAVGLVIGSLSAFVAIGGLLRILERFSAWPFAVYRAFIGAVLLAGVATGWLG